MYPIYPLSPLITHIPHNGGGSEQVNPLQTPYNKSHSLKVTFSPFTISHPCVLKKTDLTVRGFLAELHRLPLIVLSFFLGPTAITIAQSIPAY